MQFYVGKHQLTSLYEIKLQVLPKTRIMQKMKRFVFTLLDGLVDFAFSIVELYNCHQDPSRA